MEILKDIYWNAIATPDPTYFSRDYLDLANKTVSITGASGGISLEVVRLLQQTDANIIIVVGDTKKMEVVLKKIYEDISSNYNKKYENQSSMKARVSIFEADLSDLVSVLDCGKTILKKVDKIHLAIHNAGVMTPPENSVSSQGYELQLASNVLGFYLLQRYLNPIMLKSAEKEYIPRVVWVIYI